MAWIIAKSEIFILWVKFLRRPNCNMRWSFHWHLQSFIQDLMVISWWDKKPFHFLCRHWRDSHYWPNKPYGHHWHSQVRTIDSFVDLTLTNQYFSNRIEKHAVGRRMKNKQVNPCLKDLEWNNRGDSSIIYLKNFLTAFLHIFRKIKNVPTKLRKVRLILLTCLECSMNSNLFLSPLRI